MRPSIEIDESLCDATSVRLIGALRVYGALGTMIGHDVLCYLGVRVDADRFLRVSGRVLRVNFGELVASVGGARR